MQDIVTNRLHLRPPRPSDAEPLHAVFSDVEAMRYWSTLPHTDLSETQEFVQGMTDLTPDEGAEFIVEHQGDVIGKAGFWEFPEIGFIFHRDTWGQGLGREAVTALLDYGFRELGLEKITADVDPRNEASLRLLASIGFVETRREERAFEIGGVWVDSVYLECTTP